MSDHPMSDHPGSDPRALAGGQYLIDVARRLPDLGGGITAYAASSRRPGDLSLMALRVDRRAPVRPRALHTLNAGIDGLSTPVAHGLGPPVDGQQAWYVICHAPSGAPLSAGLRPWPEPALIDFVLRPIATVLEQLQSRGITHRAIRPTTFSRSRRIAR
jgi:hypothetical protein